MQSWDNQNRNQSRPFPRREQGMTDRSSSSANARWIDDGGRARASGGRTDNDDFSSYDREGRYDRSERSQYAGSQSQYDRQNSSGWGEDSSPNDDSDYRSNYQGFAERDRSQNRYGYGRDLGSERRQRSERDAQYDRYPRQDYGTAGSRYSQSEYGRGSSLDNTSVRDYDMTRGSNQNMGYNTHRSPETGFSSRSWDADTERAPYNEGSSRNDYSHQFGSHAGKGPKGFKRSDERIKEDISEILTRHPGINASDIEIEVKDGDVTLSGVVPERSMKHLAEDIVEGCMGVHDIQNQLRVKRGDESAYGSSASTTDASSKAATASSANSPAKKPSGTAGNH